MMKARRKARIAFALMSVVLLAALAVVQPFAASSVVLPTYEVPVDFDKVTFVSGSPTFLNGAIAVRNYGTVIGLGELDFAYFEKVDIQYCSDASAMSGDAGSAFCLTDSTVPVWNINDPQIIAYGNMTNAQGAWREDVRTCSIDLSQVDYKGDTYLSVFMPDGNGVDILSITFTARAYTQAEVDKILEEYINPEVSIFQNCKLNATVNYTLSLVAEGSGYDSYQKVYANLDYSTIEFGLSFKSVYSYIKDDLLGGLIYPDEGYINSVKFDIIFDVPVNVLALGLKLTNPSNLSLDCSVRYIQTGTPIAYGTILEEQGFYLDIIRDTFTPAGGTTNYNVARVELSLTHENKPLSSIDDWDDYFINLDASLFQSSSDYIQYAEAYNLGLKNGLERAESNWSAKLFQARQEALAQGQEKGEQIGYDKALKELEGEWRVHYNNGMDAGLKLGFDDGYVKGIEDGGGNKENFSINSLIFSAVDAPIRAVVNFLNFEVLGFNLADLFTGIFTFLLIGLVLFVVVKLLI